MDYRYQIDVHTGDRSIFSPYPNLDQTRTNRFRLIVFTPEDLHPYPSQMFTASHIDTLVHLFTGQDPAYLLHHAAEECPSSQDDSHKCQPISIPLPPALALHAHTLQERMDDIRTDFRRWWNDEGTKETRQYRLPDGNLEKATRLIGNGIISHPENWDIAEFHERKARRELLDTWFHQGLALRQAWDPDFHPR